MLSFIKKLTSQPPEKSAPEHAHTLTQGSTASSLVQAIEKVGVHDHLCLIYRNKKEQFDAIIPFVRIGLERGEKCVYIADENTAEDVTEAMRREGVNVDVALQTGAFSIASKQETYVRNGYFDPDEMIQFLKEVTALAKSEGYTALRVTGEMTWMLGGDPGSSRLMEYESKLNLFFPKYDCLAICQYSYDRFTPELLADVIHTHPIVVSGNTVCKNFYYIPTEEFLKTKKGSLEVERLLSTLLEREQIEKELADIAIQKEQYLNFFTLATEPMCIANPFGNFKEVNPAFVKLTGYTEGELISKPFLDFVLEEDRQKTTEEMRLQVSTRPSLSFENRYVRKDGSIIFLSWTAFFDKESGITYATARDITARKRAEAQVKKITSLYATLSQCNQAIIHNKSKEELFSRICRVAVEFGGFKMAWIGMVDETSRRVIPVASYGDTFEYLANIQISIDADDPLGRGPTGTATREGKPFWCQDFKHDPRTAPWHKYSEQSGWGASAALPLNKKGTTIGALTLYREEADSFDKPVQILLMEMADDISYALDVFDDKAEKERADIEMRNSHERLYRLLNSMGEGAYGTDTDGNCTFINRAFMQILGYQNEDEVLSKHIHEIIHYAHPDGTAYPKEACKASLAYRTNQSINVSDEVFWRKDGTAVPVEYWSHPILVNGEIAGSVNTFADITERKQIQETLGRSREALNKAQEIAQIGSWDLDVGKNILTWSDEAYKIFEVPKEVPLIYERFLECIHPDDKEFVNTSWMAAMRGGHYDIEHRIIVDHKIKWVRERAELQFDKDGNAIRGIGTTQDITERKKNEDALRASEEKFRGIFEGALDGILLADAETKHFTVSNPVIQRMLGYTPEEITDLSVQDIHPKESLLNVMEQFEKQLRGEIGLAADIPVKRKDGSIFYADIKSSPVQFGGKTYLVGVFRDITERKQAEEVLYLKSEELTKINEYLKNESAKDEALLLSIGEGMIATDDTGEIIAVNDKAEQILGWSKEELIGKKAGTVIPVVDENSEPVPPEKHAILMTITTGKVFTSSTMQYVHKKDGRRTPVAVTVNPVILEGRLIGTIAIFRDITKEKELEETRRDLLSLASHQLRTPLSGTKWLIETLIKGIHGPLNQAQSEYLDEIYKINERMTTLVHDMLSVLRMESGITAVKKEQVSMIHLVHATFDGLDAVAKDKHIALRLIEGEDYFVDVDPLLLQNVLESLVSNAINYSKPGSEAAVSIKKETAELVVIIKDSGIGIPKEEQGRIFSRFYRASNAKTFDTRGTGLGLYIASLLASKIGASISFESEEGQGSTFYIHIPLDTQNEPASLPGDLTRV